MRNAVSALVLVAVLAGCGGGSNDWVSEQDQQAAAEQRIGQVQSSADHLPIDRSIVVAAAPAMRHALSTSPVAAEALTAAAATQLFDFAERTFPAYFPSAQPNRVVDTWFYRYYPQTQTYLAVIGGRVYVMGGPFGPEVVSVGLLTDYVTLTAPQSAGAITAAQIARCPQGVALGAKNFYTCMTGALAGTQKFDTSKACTLAIGTDGVITLASGSTSLSVGPEYQRVSFTNSPTNDMFNVAVIVPVSGFDLRTLSISSGISPTFTFANGGVIDAEISQAIGKDQLSCTFKVSKS